MEVVTRFLGSLDIIAFATVIGVLVALYVAFVQVGDIRKQQKRIADRINARPRLDIGFLDIGFDPLSKHRLNNSFKVAKENMTRDSSGHFVIETQVAFENVGKLSAQGIVVNIVAPASVSFGAPSSPNPLETVAVTNHDDKVMLTFTSPTFIHPGDRFLLPVPVRIHESGSDFDMHLKVSIKDTPETNKKLHVNIS